MFYRSIRFVFKIAFYFIAENMFGALLEISDKYMINVFSDMTLQFQRKTVWKISKSYCMTLKTVSR